MAFDNHEGGDVFNNSSEASDHGAFTDEAELVYGTEAGEDGVVFYGDVACDGGVIGKNDVVADLAFMRDVGVAKKEVVVADSSWGFGGGSSVDGYVFTECVVVADDELSLFATVFEVLGQASNGGKGEGLAAFADDGVTFDNDVAIKLRLSS